jgi:hypothetical protein
VLVVTVVVVTMPMPAMQINLQDQADHMLHLTVMADQVVTDRADQAAIRAAETDRVVVLVVTVAVEPVATDQVVLVTDPL